MDTTTGLVFNRLDQKIQEGIPNLKLACHRIFKDMDKPDVVGSMFDGSANMQCMLSLSTDADTLCTKYQHLTEGEQDNIIKYIDGVYCHLEVTNLIKMQARFADIVVKRGDRIYLSTTKFRRSFIAGHDKAEAMLGIGSIMQKEYDQPGKASVVRQYAGQHPLDCVYYIPCRGWPKTAVPYNMVDIHVCGECARFYLVPKCRPNGDPEIEWRISFAPLENAIIKTIWTDTDHAAYTLLKCLIKTHISMPEALSSYHLKSCMFFTQSSYPPRAKISLSQRLVTVIDFLLHTLAEEFLPLPFVEDTNAYADVAPDALKSVCQKVCNLRKNFNKLPNDLGLYGNRDVSGVRRQYDEIVHLMLVYTFKEIKRAAKSSKFVALKELCVDPETHLYMFESFLYKALLFVKLNDEIWVKYAMMSKYSQLRRYHLFQDFLGMFFAEGNLFGLEDQASTDARAIDEKCRLLQAYGTSKVFYHTFNGIAFGISERLLGPHDVPNTQLLLLSCVNQNYFDTKTEIIEMERNHTSTAGLCNLLNTYYTSGVYEVISLSSLEPKRSVVFNLWSSRRAMIHIQNDISMGMFTELGPLATDPETILCVFESYVEASVILAYPTGHNLVQQVLLSYVGKFFFIHTLEKFFNVRAARPELLGCPQSDEQQCTKPNEPNLFPVNIHVIQMYYDGIAFSLHVIDDQCQELYNQDRSFIQIDVPGAKILLNTTTQIYAGWGSKPFDEVDPIIQCLPVQDLRYVFIAEKLRPIRINHYWVNINERCLCQFYIMPDSEKTQYIDFTVNFHK